MPLLDRAGSHLTRGIALLFVLGLAQCGPSAVADPDAEALLRRVERAQKTYAFRGIRVRTQSDREGAAAETSRFRERVFHRGADDRGEERHLVELLDVLAADEAPADWKDESFEQQRLSHRVRSNFIERFREFRLRDVDLALENYEARLGAREQVLGRACRVLVLTPRETEREHSFGRGHYELWVDEETGYPLRTREYQSSGGGRGSLVAQSEFKEFAPLSNDVEVDWPIQDAERRTLGEREVPEFLAGREIGQPVPLTGFRTVRREAVSWDGVGKFVVHVLSDGVEPLLVLQGLPLDGTRLVAPGGGGERPESRPSDLEVLVVEFGRTLSLHAVHDGVSIYVVGKGSRRDLQAYFESLFLF